MDPNTFTYQDFKQAIMIDQKDRMLFQGTKRELFALMMDIYRWSKDKTKVLIVDMAEGYLEIKVDGDRPGGSFTVNDKWHTNG